MAATLTTQTLQDGERNAVIHGVITGDGLGELTDGLLVDVSGLSGAPSTVKIAKIKCTSTSAISTVLEWDATANVAVFVVPENADIDIDYRDVGGLQNNAGAGITGDIVATTTGEAAGEYAIITIWVQKS